jgi:FkbM family methyltransferase
LVTEARSVARRFGLIGPLGTIRRRVERALGKVDYEARFNEALTSALRPGDVVWDVGANVGVYTSTFAELVGSSGIVCSFEPVPSCFAELERRTRAMPNVRCFAMALGDREMTAPIWTSDDPFGVTNSLVQGAAKADGRTVSVPVRAGDALVGAHLVPAPNVLKIDVEGFEEEVLTGLTKTLERPECRAVFIEVHFAILEGRGARHAPSRIKSLLGAKGFEARWTDGSHLAAERRAPP